MENYRRSDGRFHFKLCYPPHKMNTNGVWMNGDSQVSMDSICNEWTQTSNPITEGTITGFHKIHLDFPHKGNQQPWGGLGRTNVMNDSNIFPSLIDDTGTDGFWWMAIGATSPHQYNDTFPGPFWHNVKKVDFYVNLERGRTGRGGIQIILIFVCYFQLHCFILVLGRNNLWATLPDWGPTFQVSFDLHINSYSGLDLRFGSWAEMLRFTTTETDCCNVGDRIPAIFTHAHGYVHFTMIMNGQNWVKDLRLNEKTWYQIDMTQYHAGNV